MSDYRAVAPPPEPPRANARLFPLAFEVEGLDVITTRARRVYVLRGLLCILALPPLLALLVALVTVGLVTERLPADIDWLTGSWAVLAGASVLWGLSLIVFSRRLSRRGSVRFDRSRGVVSANGQQEPFAGLEVRVRKLEGITGWNAIELWRGATKVAIVNERLQPQHRRDIATHVEYLGRLLDAPVVAAPDAAIGPANKHAIADNTAAMLCYLPFQGIHLVASLYYVFAARERPFVRFAAKQSLLQLAFTFVALFVFGVGFGVPLAISADGERELSGLSIVFIVLLALSLGAVAIGNVVAHIVACLRAYSGRAWVIPWLSPISARWLPPPTEPPK